LHIADIVQKRTLQTLTELLQLLIVEVVKVKGVILRRRDANLSSLDLGHRNRKRIGLYYEVSDCVA